jgi:transcription antitermination factor NusG
MIFNPERESWYGVRTRLNHERTAATILQAKGYEQYLPAYKVRRRWSDRIVETSLPLFPGYVFCRFDAHQRLPIVSTPGVVSILGFGSEPAVIPEEEIAAIETLLRSGIGVEPCPFLLEGQRIRVNRGALEGVEGILIKKKSNWRIAISITLLQRSVSVEVDHDWITAI